MADRTAFSCVLCEVNVMQMRRSIALVIGALAAFGCKDQPSGGILVVNVTGLPSGANAQVRVTGPENFLRALTGSATLENLTPGEYIVRIDTILHNGTKYGSPLSRDTIQVDRGQMPTADVPYTVSSGSLNLTITGLSAGTPANVWVVGETDRINVVASGIVPGLAPGKYYVQSDTMISTLGDRFGASNTLDSVNVLLSATPATASVAYTLVSGTLAVTVSGLAPNVLPPITVTGPGGYVAKFAGSQTIRGLLPGTYTVTPETKHGPCPAIHRTSSPPQTVSIPMGLTASTTFNYVTGTADPAELNLRIASVHVIQVTQDAQWSVPMIAGRSAFVRVFGVANQCNTVTPKVRLTIGGAAPVTLNAPESAVHFETAESSLGSTWNYNVPANLVQDGMSIIAEIDPDGAVAENNESDNRYPSAGSRAVIVKSVPAVGVRFVPITQTVGGVAQTGAVADQLEALMYWTRRVFPVATWDVDVREPLTISRTLTNAIVPWVQTLDEIEQLHALDSAALKPGFRRYYYGVAKLAAPFGIIGLGYVPGRSAMGWDRTSGSDNAGSTFAHELGHNFGRLHAPCGNPGNPDNGYPNSGFYAGGGIGVYGYDQFSGSLIAPSMHTDIMGYCPSQWISDYTYRGVMTYLADPSREPSLAVAGSGTRQPSLLIWGRIENGVPMLEPAFEIDAYPSVASNGGPHRIAALDANGAEIFSFAFNGKRIADVPGDYESFSFVVPLSQLKGRSIASLRLSARGRTATNVASADRDADPGVLASRAATGHVRLRWDAARFPVVLVRSKSTGNVIAFARGGDATIAATQAEIEVNASNRVRSARRTIKVLR
jgi:hypothetical protein